MHPNNLSADVEMTLRQIIAIVDLMLNLNSENTPNLLTIRDLALSGLNKIADDENY